MAKSRLCLNPECNESFIPMSDKAKYCCLKCRNRRNFLLKKKEDEQENKFMKGFKKNSKILLFLYNNGSRTVSDSILKALNFDDAAIPAPGLDKDGQRGLSFGKYSLKFINDNTYEIIKN